MLQLTSLCLFLTFVFLLSTNPQFISFNQYSSTGKYPAVFFYVAIVLSILYVTLFVASLFGLWAVSKQSLFIIKLVTKEPLHFNALAQTL